jgi:hypothetical protein
MGEISALVTQIDKVSARILAKTFDIPAHNAVAKFGVILNKPAFGCTVLAQK